MKVACALALVLSCVVYVIADNEYPGIAPGQLDIFYPFYGMGGAPANARDYNGNIACPSCTGQGSNTQCPTVICQCPPPTTCQPDNVLPPSQPTTTQGSTVEPVSELFYIQNKVSGLVLDVKECHNTKFIIRPVIMYPYNGNAQQLWYTKGRAIFNECNGWALDMAAVGDRFIYVSIYDSSLNTKKNQKWRFDYEGHIWNDLGVILDTKNDTQVAGDIVVGSLNYGKAKQKYKRVYAHSP